MIEAVLIDLATGKALDTRNFGDFGIILTVADPLRVRGVFKSLKFTVAGGADSFTVATPAGDGSIVLSDLVVSFEKLGTEVTIQFNDGTNTELIWYADLKDAPISFAIAFAGKWQGWQCAYLEVVTSAGIDGSVGVGYAKVSKRNSLKYAEWNKRR